MREQIGGEVQGRTILVVLALLMTLGCSHFVRPRETPAKRPFYLVAHRANSAAAVEKALREGANALELDVRVHEGQFCANHDPVILSCERLDALLDRIRAAREREDGSRLALVFYDFKNDDGMQDAGAALLQLIRARLTDATQVKTLISIATLADQKYLDGAYHGLQSGEALAVDYENEPVKVSTFMRDRNVSNFAYGDGCCVACICPGATAAVKEALHRKEELGFKLVYVWTLGKQTSMQDFIRLGADGIFVNGGWVLGTQDDIPVLSRLIAESSVVELAPPEYNPFP